MCVLKVKIMGFAVKILLINKIYETNYPKKVYISVQYDGIRIR